MIFDEYASAVKWGIYLSILTIIVTLLGTVSKGLINYGHQQAMLEVAAARAERDADNARRIMKLQNQNDSEPKVNTVTETIETIRYVDRYIEKQVYVCDDLGDVFVRVRNEIRKCIFGGSSVRDCLE